MITLAQRNSILILSNRTGHKVSMKFQHEVERFLLHPECKINRKNKSGIRYGQGPFEMIYLHETEKYYFVSQY